MKWRLICWHFTLLSSRISSVPQLVSHLSSVLIIAYTCCQAQHRWQSAPTVTPSG
uniref:Uncharacterized protein n=1 Tax=Arundo donax TaxID=35708 RepID=A0A0A9BCU6_ARUDO